MKVVFIGGAGLRNLPIIRELLKLKKMDEKSEIALYDLAPERADVIAAMARKTPEWKDKQVRISVPHTLEEALTDASYVYFAILQASKESRVLSGNACMEHDLLGYPDNLSIRGSVSAAWNIPIILNVARIMEKVAPEAWLIIFTNPVPLLVSAVHQASRIKAVGVCAGFANHNYDLPRIMGWPEPDFGFEADVAGVNHCSWILKCRYHGKDFFPMLDQRIKAGMDYAHIEPFRTSDPALHRHLMFVLPKMIESHEMFGGMLYSSEPDGLPHVCYYDECLEFQRSRPESLPTDATRAASTAEWQEFASFAEQKILPADFWSKDDRYWKGFKYPETAIGVRMIRGLSGETQERLVASYPNRGAIRDVPEDLLMEYSMLVSGDGIRPAGKYSLPPAVRGMMRSLAEHQYLVADALCRGSRKDFMASMYAYPLLRSKQTADSLIQRLFEINADRIPDYLSGGK
ncbi:MAG: hypothetical protein WAX69_14025 [Victivallales bacterium]